MKDRIEVVRVNITGRPDYIVSATEWVENGRQPGFKKKYKIDQNQITGLEHTYMDLEIFNALEPWKP